MARGVQRLDFAHGRSLHRLANPGSPFGGATDLKLALWTTYKFSGGEVNGWKAGGGSILQSKMYREDASHTLPASHVFEARLGYAWKECTVGLNIENVFDARWFIASPAVRLEPAGDAPPRAGNPFLRMVTGPCLNRAQCGPDSRRVSASKIPARRILCWNSVTRDRERFRVQWSCGRRVRC